ncbi:MAG: sulfurtransferase TusA family protein [Thermoleophilia bacterium]
MRDQEPTQPDRSHAAPPHADRVLDASGLACPMPLLKAHKALQELASGQVLQVVTTDPSSANDMRAWMNKSGHTLVAQNCARLPYVFYIRKE